MKTGEEVAVTFHELARARFSVRHYTEESVEDDALRAVLEAARIAPSAANNQPWHFIVVRDQKIRDEVASTYGGRWLRGAPIIIVACGDRSLSWKRDDGKDHLDIDLAIAIDHMTLAAAERGLGTCWICAFDVARCHRILGLPASHEVIALLPLGHSSKKGDPDRHTASRKKLEEIVSWDGYEG
jgi:nitroreductase